MNKTTKAHYLILKLPCNYYLFVSYKLFILTDFLSPISINSDNDEGIISTSLFIREIKTISMNDNNQPCKESTISRETGDCDFRIVFIKREF
jgi:hypothetical protein